MAIPSVKLINLLLATASDIETNPDYSWSDTENCNCGLLAKNAGVVDRKCDRSANQWTYRAKSICQKTGVPLDKAVKVLFDFGLDSVDIENLEWCVDSIVLDSIPEEIKAMDTNLYKEESRTFVAAYLRTWAKILSRQLAQQSEKNQISVTQEEVVRSTIQWNQ